MRKPELIDGLVRVAALTKQERRRRRDGVRVIAVALVKGDKVELRGFGRFRVRQHRARMGRNPKARTLAWRKR